MKTGHKARRACPPPHGHPTPRPPATSLLSHLHPPHIPATTTTLPCLPSSSPHRRPLHHSLTFLLFSHQLNLQRRCGAGVRTRGSQGRKLLAWGGSPGASRRAHSPRARAPTFLPQLSSLLLSPTSDSACTCQTRLPNSTIKKRLPTRAPIGAAAKRAAGGAGPSTTPGGPAPAPVDW